MRNAIKLVKKVKKKTKRGDSIENRSVFKAVRVLYHPYAIFRNDTDCTCTPFFISKKSSSSFDNSWINGTKLY